MVGLRPPIVEADARQSAKGAVPEHYPERSRNAKRLDQIGAREIDAFKSLNLRQGELTTTVDKLFPWWKMRHERPTIYILRERADTVGSAVDETCVIAHEFGHYRSYQDIGFSEFNRHVHLAKRVKELDGYKTMTDDERRSVWKDETDAWEVGRKELAEFARKGSGEPFSSWDRFETLKAEALATYRKALGMPTDAG